MFNPYVSHLQLTYCWICRIFSLSLTHTHDELIYDVVDAYTRMHSHIGIYNIISNCLVLFQHPTLRNPYCMTTSVKKENSSTQKKDLSLWCKNVQTMARTFENSNTGVNCEEQSELQEPWWPTCYAVFNKGFSLHHHPPPPYWLKGPLAAPQTLTDRCPWWSRTRSAWRHKQLWGCERS